MKILNSLNKDKGANLKIKSLVFTMMLLTSLLLMTLYALPVKACHTVGTYESDYETPKTIFMRGETVYGKEYYNPPQHLKLRIRDPSNNEVFCSDPVYDYTVTCAYPLNDSAPLGVWNIQVGLFFEGSWHWLDAPGDISYFDVIEPTKYFLDIEIKGTGTVAVNPDQEEYDIGTVVTLTPNPGSNWKFDHWSGDLSGSSNPISITMDSNKSITVNFVKKNTGGNNEGSSSNSGSSSSSSIGNDESLDDEISEEHENIHPHSIIIKIYEGSVDSQILFDGTLSFDSDGSITDWQWDFGDGTNGTGKTVYHNYSKAGVYTVNLKVTDNKGAFDHSEISLEIIQPEITGEEITEKLDVDESKDTFSLLWVFFIVLLIALLLIYVFRKKHINNRT